MQHISSAMPDNLKSRISRVHVDSRSFTDQSTNREIQYKKLVLDILIKDELFSLEFKLDKKDAVLLALADVVDKSDLR